MTMENITEMLIILAGKIFLVIILFFVGRFVIKNVVKIMLKGMDKKGVEVSLQKFLTSLFQIIFYILLVVTIAATMGAEMTAFVALIGALGIAIGFALQGSLANFAGGVLILILKPFQVGDFIEAAGHMGTVEEIQVFYTLLKTPDNHKIIIPNAKLSNNSAINYSAKSTRRMNITVGVGYDSDIGKVKNILFNMVQNHPLVLDDPIPQVVLVEYADSSINFSVRAWCNTTEYWTAYWEIMENIKGELDKENISIPFPQMDVHMPKR